jgi:hypothetical protein
MANEKARTLAEQILDDFRGSCYYADPEILGRVLENQIQSSADAKTAVREILRQLLHKYASRCQEEQDLEELADLIEGFGVQ